MTLRTGTTGAFTEMDGPGRAFLSRVAQATGGAKILGGFGMSTREQVRPSRPLFTRLSSAAHWCGRLPRAGRCVRGEGQGARALGLKISGHHTTSTWAYSRMCLSAVTTGH